MNQVTVLPSILWILIAAVCVVALFKKLKLSPVLGYFVAGGIIGEHGFKVVTSSDISIFGEFGVVFLLFAIGLELTFERLKSMRYYVFGFGSMQVIITSVTVCLCLVKFLNLDLNAAVIIGCAISLSSTAIVLQVIAENRQQSTQVGRISLAVLLMQDFAVVPLLVLVSILSGDHVAVVHQMGAAMIKAVAALVGIFILGRIFLRPIFGLITSSNAARSNEIFIAATLLIALGSAWATEHMGLSLALGAFVAGLLVAETEFQLQAEESIEPFKGLFLGLFFMTVGMSINLEILVQKIGFISAMAFSLISIKALILVLLCIIFRFKLGVAIHTGLLLAQGSEFAFILFNLSQASGLIDKDLGQALLLVVTISMALTPLLAFIGEKIEKRLDKKSKISPERAFKDIADLDNHVIILGFGDVGEMVAKLLAAENVNYIGIELDSELVSEKRKEGYPIFLGDASNLDLLKSVGIGRAGSVILALNNEVTLKKASKTIRANFPNIPIIVRVANMLAASGLYEVGATTVVPEDYETGLQLGGAVLKSVGISEFEVSRIKNKFRAGDYKFAKEDDNDDAEKPQVKVGI